MGLLRSNLDRIASEVCQGRHDFRPEECPDNGRLCVWGNICRDREGYSCLITEFQENCGFDPSPDELQQIEEERERQRGGNLAYNNNREPVR